MLSLKSNGQSFECYQRRGLEVDASAGVFLKTYTNEKNSIKKNHKEELGIHGMKHEV